MPNLTPANNPVVKANPAGLASAAQSPMQPGMPTAPSTAQSQNVPVTGLRMPRLYEKGQGPVTSQISPQQGIKASPTTPQPARGLQPQSGQFGGNPGSMFSAQRPNKIAAIERKIRWGQEKVYGIDALQDFSRYMTSRAIRNSEFELPEKEAAAAEPISAFAAAFFFGCRERGLSIDAVEQLTKVAAASDGIVAAELAGLTERVFQLCRRKLASIEDGIMPSGTKSPIPEFLSKPTTAVPKLSPTPAAAPAAAPVAASGPKSTATPAASSSGRFSPLGLATTAMAPSSLLTGGLASGVADKLKGWGNAAGNKAKELLQSGKDLAVSELTDAGNRAVQNVAANPENRKAINDTVAGATNTAMDTATGNAKDKLKSLGSAVLGDMDNPNTFGGGLAQFGRDVSEKGFVPAIGNWWGNLTPEQQMGVVTGGLGLGGGAIAALSGHPLLGAALGLGGLGAGGALLHHGSGEVANQFLPHMTPEQQKSFKDWSAGGSDEAAAYPGASRSQQYGWWQQQLAEQRQQQAASQAKSELERSMGGGAMTPGMMPSPAGV